MLIVDSQVHIWVPNSPEHPWKEGGKPHRPIPLTMDDLLREMDSAGVQRAVLIPSSLLLSRNALSLEAARMHPDRFAVMGLFDFSIPDAQEKILTWRQQPGMLGIRFSFNNQKAAAPNWFWEKAEMAGLPIMIMADHRLPLVEQLAKQYPALKFAVDHLATPHDGKDEEAFADFDDLLALAKYPNVAVKASALAARTSDAYPFRRLHPYIRRVYDAFGPKRIFWGTDFSNLKCTYSQAVTMFTEEIPWLTSEDKEWIMGRGLCEWIGWRRPQ